MLALAREADETLRIQAPMRIKAPMRKQGDIAASIPKNLAPFRSHPHHPPACAWGLL